MCVCAIHICIYSIHNQHVLLHAYLTWCDHGGAKSFEHQTTSKNLNAHQISQVSMLWMQWSMWTRPAESFQIVILSTTFPVKSDVAAWHHYGIGTHSQPIRRANPVQQLFYFELFGQTQPQCPVLHRCSSKKARVVYITLFPIYLCIFRPHALITCETFLHVFIYIYIHRYIDT